MNDEPPARHLLGVPAFPRGSSPRLAARPDDVVRLPRAGAGRGSEVTTTIRGIPQEVQLGRREGLPKACVANLDAMRTVPRSCLTIRIGAVRYAKQNEIKRAIGHVLAWPELTSL